MPAAVKQEGQRKAVAVAFDSSLVVLVAAELAVATVAQAVAVLFELAVDPDPALKPARLLVIQMLPELQLQLPHLLQKFDP